MTVLPAIGYDHPDQSHFTSRHYWEVGATDPRLLTGWLGRYLDVAGVRRQPAAGPLDHRQPRAFARDGQGARRGDRRPEPVQLRRAGRLGHRRRTACSTRWARSAACTRATRPSATAANVTKQSDRLRRQLLPFAEQNGITSPVPYPTGNDGFTTGLQGVAAMIAANLPLRCVALEASGSYDTHAGQAAALTPALTTTAASLYSFQRDLEARGIADRVLTLVWSEFGRRAQENGSGGTDHGAAGTAFLIGSRTIGTAVGEFPGLASLDADGNLKATSDFRSVYSSLLEQWLGLRRRPGDPGRREVQALQARQVKTLAALALSAFALAGSTPAPARVQIVAREYSYTLSRLHVKAGTAILELDNFGQDSARPAGPARRVEARREARQGRAREVRRSDAAPASGAILALVLDRKPSPEGNARDADRHALTFDDVGDPAGLAGPVLPRRRRLAPHPAPGRRDRRVARHSPDRRRPLGPGRARPDARHLGARRRGARRRASASTGSRSSAGRPAARTRWPSPRCSPSGSRASCSSARCRLPDRTRPLARDVRLSLRAATLAPRFLARRLEAWGRKPTPPTGHPGHRRRLPAWAHRVVPRRRDVARPRARRARPALGLRSCRGSSAPVTLWWGESDAVCPPSIGRDYEARLPAATLKLVDGTHQVLFPRWPDILEDALPR